MIDFVWPTSFSQAVAPGADQRQQLWLAHIHGIIKSYGVGHWLSLWLARVHPAIRGLFAALYGTEDLIVSFDGGNWLQVNPTVAVFV